MTEFVTSPLAGIDLSAVTAGTTTDGAGAPYKLGTRVMGSNNSEFVFCQAGAAISTTTKQSYCLAIDEAFQAVKVTKALASAGHQIGFAPAQIIADNAFFWAQVKGGQVPIRVAVSCAADVNLWTTATAGLLDDTSGGSHVAVLGVKITAAASASTSEGNTTRVAIVTNTLVPLLIA